MATPPNRDLSVGLPGFEPGTSWLPSREAVFSLTSVGTDRFNKVHERDRLPAALRRVSEVAYFINEHLRGLNIQEVPDTVKPHKASLR